MVRENEDAFYRYEFAIHSRGRLLPDYAQEYYVRLLSRSKHVLRGSFGLYPAWDATTAQNRQRKTPAADDSRAGDRRREQLGRKGR